MRRVDFLGSWSISWTHLDKLNRKHRRAVAAVVVVAREGSGGKRRTQTNTREATNSQKSILRRWHTQIPISHPHDGYVEVSAGSTLPQRSTNREREDFSFIIN